MAGGVYHIVSRGNAQASIYRDEHDRLQFFECLDEALSAYAARCHAYCLMGNHYHLLVETSCPNLSLTMRQINGVYGQRYNRRHRRTGHVFQGRFSATLVDRDAYLLEVCRYIVLNPLRASLVKRPEDWPWSSHRAYLDLVTPPPFLCTSWILSVFDESGGTRARSSYARFIEDATTRPDLIEQIRRAPPSLGNGDLTPRPDPKT
jgi:REP element-mobilizing transposase RayT